MKNKQQKTLFEMDSPVTADFLDLFPASITIHDANGNFVYANERTFNLHGYSKKEFLKLKLHQLDTPESARLIESRMQELFVKGETSFEVEHYRKDKTLLPLHIFVKVIHWFDREMILSIALDNTEVSDSRRKIRERETIITHILEQTLAGYWDWHIPSGNEYLSPTFKKMFGYNDDELANRAETWQKLLFPDDLKNVLEAYKKHVESHGDIPYYNEVRYRHKDGSTVWVICSGKVIEWDDSGNPVRMVGCHVDITRRKQIEQEVENRGIKLERILENAFEGISIVDATGKVLYESPVLNHILGYCAEERRGGNAFENIHPDDLENVRNEFRIMLDKHGESKKIVFRIRHKNGNWRFVECNGTNLLADPAIKGIVVNYRDITDQKKAEEERLQLERQVQQSQKLESLGTLAAGIAHDFNNLLAGIFGYLDMARTLSKDPEITEYLQSSLRTMNRARGLTQQLLTFAKGGAPHLKTGNLSQTIREAVGFASSGSNVSCVFDISSDLWSCDYDTIQIGQVIDNLVINAQQAMPAGGTITIEGRNVTIKHGEHSMLKPGRYVKISVSDAGVGIPKKIIGRIFEPFFTTKQKGSGLGLATGYSIIKRHKGIIEVESESGRGSTFHVFLPASDMVVEKGEPESGYTINRTGKILIMDDEEVVRNSLSAMLRHHGFEAVLSKDGEEALRLFDESRSRDDPPLAIILDMTIPGGMGGKEAIAEIRKRDTKIPVIVSSGYSEDPIISHPADYGFTASIRKPFTREELLDVLSKNIK